MPGINKDCGCTPEQVDLMFKRAEQFIDEQIADRTYRMARYWTDLFPVKDFPDGAGLILDKVRFYGDIGPQYDGVDGWRTVQTTRRGAAAALVGENDGCGYQWEEVGHGMETVSYDLMQRDLHTKPICIKDIRTFWQYQETQNLIFQNLTNISANMREQLNRNAAYGYAIKHVALPGFPVNKADPHQLPVIPSGVEVGKLTYPMLLQFYHILAQEAGAYAIAQISGMPAFGLVGHPETLHELYYSDPDLRADLRECRGAPGGACDLISRYNFLDGIGPYVFMPDLYAPRYNRDANGVLSRVFPFDRSVPIETGTRPITNPDYHTAEFELILLMTRDLFTLRTRRALSSVGGQTNFDAEVGMFEWKWHNPERCEDPYRRTGRYVTTAEIGIEPGDFTDIVAILVKRKPTHVGIEFWGAQVCPPDPVECDNELGPQTCPCPQVTGVSGAVADDELIIQFDRATGVSAEDTVQLETPNGGFVSGTVEEVNTDGTILRVSFASAVEAVPGMFVGLLCQAIEHCSAKVLSVELCGIHSSPATVTLVTNRLLKGVAAGENLTLNMCDGTQITAAIQEDGINAGAFKYTVALDYPTFCANGGVCSVCVPTETEASCPACDASEFEECEEDSDSG